MIFFLVIYFLNRGGERGRGGEKGRENGKRERGGSKKYFLKEKLNLG